MVEEARLEQLEAGLTPVTDGWFVVNVRDGAWVTSDAFGARCILEGERRAPSPTSASRSVLQPGQPNGMYHSRDEPGGLPRSRRRVPAAGRGRGATLRAWDFVHCPPGTEHIFVGAGDGPCVIFMTGGANAGEAHRLSALGARPPPRRRRRDGDDLRRRGVRLVPEVAARPAGRLGRAALGLDDRSVIDRNLGARAPTAQRRRGRPTGRPRSDVVP